MLGINADLRKQLRFFFTFFKPHTRFILLVGLGILFGVLLQVPLPLITRHIIDHVLPEKNTLMLNWIVLALILFMVFGLVNGMLSSYLSTRLKEDILNSFQLAVFARFLRVKYAYFKEVNSGYLAARVENDVNNLRGLLANNFILFLKDVLTFAVGACLIFSFHWKLSLMALTVMPFYIVTLIKFSGLLRCAAAEVEERQAKVFEMLQESLAGILITKAFQLIAREKDRLTVRQKARREINIRFSIISSASGYVANLIGGIGPMIVLWYGAREIMAGNLSLGTFIAFNSFLGYLFGPVGRFLKLNEQVQDALASLERINELLSLPVESSKPGGAVPDLSGKIEFQNVTFSYSGATDIVKDADFCIYPAEKVALVGKSGVGKSTLAHIINGFFEPNKGRLLFDDIPQDELDLEGLRSQIGFVPARGVPVQ